MMPNVVRGERMGGLMVYLAGPGRSNEHTEPHLVARDSAMMAWHDDNELSRDDALVIARHLDHPKRAHDVEVKGGHVWHCSLSLRAEEGQLTDEKWREVAESFVAKMGFDDHEGTKAPTRWVAVRHGLSSNGNDHVHLVVNLVREDGTKASIHNDHVRAQKACRQLEAEHGLQKLESTERGRASRGYDPAEREADARRRARGKFEGARRASTKERTWWGLDKAERDGLIAAQMREDQPRWALARTVRACATASVDEAEFVRRIRHHGILARPRHATGTQDVITGYSVAAKPEPGQRPIWYGGGRLARDLTLPRLRAEWPNTAETTQKAAAEWKAATRGRRPVEPGRETREPEPALWHEVGQHVEQLREQLRSVPVKDRDTWARAARQTSGAFAAWSIQTEDTPGPLTATSDALARTAERRRHPMRPERTRYPVRLYPGYYSAKFHTTRGHPPGNLRHEHRRPGPCQHRPLSQQHRFLKLTAGSTTSPQDPAPCVADTAYGSARLTTPITEYARTPLSPTQRSYNRTINAQRAAAGRATATVTARIILTTRYRRALHTINDIASFILYKQFTE